MAEELTLTTPTSITGWRVLKLTLDWEGAGIKVTVQAPTTGEVTIHSYMGAQATALMVSLNKANLTISSLHKRVLERLVADGKLPDGTVTGAPD